MISLWYPARVPEPEAMEEGEEVEAYASAAAQRHLEAVDATFVDHALRLGVSRGKALDIGTGPGQIPIALAQRAPGLEVVGIDRSELMLDEGRDRLGRLGLVGRVWFEHGDGGRLGFPDGSFDLVLCNSVLHHLADPVAVLDEIARVLRPEGALLLRDLRRPSRLLFPWHLRWHGRHYDGKMRALFEASVRAAYTPRELQVLLAKSRLRGARTFCRGALHLGLERPARKTAFQK